MSCAFDGAVKKVWIVTVGEYDDYKIVGVYTSESQAVEAKKRFGSDNDIEPWDVDQMPPVDPAGYPYEVSVWWDRDEATITPLNSTCVGLEVYGFTQKHGRRAANKFRTYCYLRAADEAAALSRAKVVLDRLKLKNLNADGQQFKVTADGKLWIERGVGGEIEWVEVP